MNDWHPTHIADEPRNIGFGTGLVHCLACGALLRSDRGVATAARVTEPRQPVAVGFRDAAPKEGLGALGFVSNRTPKGA